MTHQLRFFFAFILVTFLISCKKPVNDLAHTSLIPLPASVVVNGGAFELTADAIIYAGPTPELKAVARYIADKLKPATGFDLKVADLTNDLKDGSIVLSLSTDDKELGNEGYEINIDDKILRITANRTAGIFLAFQTLRQIFPSSIESSTVQPGPWIIGTGIIRDYPQYAWRGAMLDVARHFFSVEDVKRYIDLISAYKINILHLHLSDDQGWRIEIKSWPDLTRIGGHTQVGGGKGGFYTQVQYSDIVNYAKSRYITIVPEIDLPGHINSALASYGDLNGGTIVPAEGRVTSPLQTSFDDLGKKGKSRQTELYSGIEVGWSTLRVEKPMTFKFIDDVIREISAITPGPFMHIGGDEARATKKEDYIVFINRLTKIVKDHHKKMVGWEEIAQGTIDDEVLTQYWHSSKYALMAVEKGSKIIMSPSKKTYLDMKYDSTQKLGLHWAGYIEVDTAYQWDPRTLVIGLSEQNIAGVEAPLWSETIASMSDIEYLLFPRLPGYAEIAWSKPTGRTWDEYKVRLGKQGPRFKALGINYYKSKRVPWTE